MLGVGVGGFLFHRRRLAEALRVRRARGARARVQVGAEGAYMYVCMYVCTNIYIYIYIYIYMIVQNILNIC